MKKSLLCLLLSSVFTTGVAHAIDRSATITISGAVSAPSQGDCTVLTSQQSVQLSGTTDHLPQQDKTADHVNSTFVVTVGGDEVCVKKISDHRIAIKFSGTSDSANGTVLANTDTSESAAKGVGIGLYTPDGQPLDFKTYQPEINSAAPISLGLKMVQLNGQTPEAGSVQGAMTIEVVRL
ncbi:fimbrial protein [Cronobacter dublinensis]|uniref:fimbrial protein n=1 Tax=Cronobacter dublinensis TaxID=413497 RepID=UPI00300DCEF1